MNKTKIEYLTHTWNPIAMKCTAMSEGCRNCWHLAMAKRLAKNPLIDEGVRAAYAGGIPALDNKELEAPLHLRGPSRIGVQFMGDLFHEDIPSCLSSIWGVMKRCPQHSFFILTKRPAGAKEAFDYTLFDDPLPNIWLGVSVEDQKTADERIPILLQVPAAHRWVSVEPILGPVEIPEKVLCPCSCFAGNPRIPHPDCADKPSIDWVACGGETGPKARPMHPDWVRSLRDQCQQAGVPFFFKGWGEWGIDGQSPFVSGSVKDEKMPTVKRIGHKKSGRLLDGREWNELAKERR